MSHTLTLPSELTIYVAAEVRAAWLDWLAGTDEADTVDGSRVGEIDAAGLQCLMALAHSLERRGRRLCVADPSEALRNACRRLGASHLLAAAATAEETGA